MEVIILNTVFLICFALAVSWFSSKMANLNLRKATVISLIAGLIGAAFGDAFYAISSIGIVSMVLSSMGITVFVGLSIVAWRFYRDPDRLIPEEDDVIVSPADGKVVYIRQFTSGVLPNSIKGQYSIPIDTLVKTKLANNSGYLIGIAMSLLDVHVNRAPIAGDVLFQKHSSGAFLSLKNQDAELENERNTVLIANNVGQIAVIQIASKQVRRIVSYVKQGDMIKKGDKIGKIRLGSQVDIIIPNIAGLEILVREGEQVYSGQTILARFKLLNAHGIAER